MFKVCNKKIIKLKKWKIKIKKYLNNKKTGLKQNNYKLKIQKTYFPKLVCS
jgi:hypothetical protein